MSCCRPARLDRLDGGLQLKGSLHRGMMRWEARVVLAFITALLRTLFRYFYIGKEASQISRDVGPKSLSPDIWKRNRDPPSSFVLLISGTELPRFLGSGVQCVGDFLRCHGRNGAPSFSQF